MKSFIEIWKRDFNFRITVVFGVLYFIDLGLSGKVHIWIWVPYFTSVAYSGVKAGVEHKIHRRFMKENKKLQDRFEVASEKRDLREMERLLVLMTEAGIEYGKKMGYTKSKEGEEIEKGESPE